MKISELIVNRRFLVVAGLCLTIETILSPGFQPCAALIGGALIGWNIQRAITGDRY